MITFPSNTLLNDFLLHDKCPYWIITHIYKGTTFGWYISYTFSYNIYLLCIRTLWEVAYSGGKNELTITSPAIYLLWITIALLSSKIGTFWNHITYFKQIRNHSQYHPALQIWTCLLSPDALVSNMPTTILKGRIKH